MPASIKISNLCKHFEDIIAVNDLSLTAYPSQIIALLGPNGAGKSTLMNMISGYLTPTSGNIDILDLSDPTEIKKNIGFLPEGSPLYDDMSVKSFLRYIAKLKSQPLSEVDKVMNIANISHVSSQKIETLSKGYKRRVGFATAIIGNPPILLLDEPTDGLDPNQKDHMLNIIREMSYEKTIIISTHLLDEAQSISNRIIIMNNGKIKADGDVEAIQKQTQTSSLENAFIKLTR